MMRIKSYRESVLGISSDREFKHIALLYYGVIEDITLKRCL